MRKTFAVTALTALSLAVAAPVAIGSAQAQTQLIQTQPKPVAVQHPTWEKIKGNWTVAKGHVKEKWGKLTDDDMTRIEGRRDVLVGRVQARYGVTHAQAEKQVSDWEVRYGG